MEYCQVKGLQNPISRLIHGFMMVDCSDQNRVNDLLDRIYALGVNTFDTAPVYGNHNEISLGRWIAERGMEGKVNVLTKCAHHNAFRSRVTPYDILSDCHDSLARLNVKTIDIYLLHRDNPAVAVEPIVDTMNRLCDAGKIRIFGVSNWTADRIEQANNYAARYGLESFKVSSPHHSLAEQVETLWSDDCVTLTGAENGKEREFYRNTQMPVLAYSSLSRGFLTGKVKSSDPEGAKEVLEPFAYKAFAHPVNFERLKRCEIMAEQLNLTVPQVATAWLFAQEEPICAIVGTNSAKRMEENVVALNTHLTPQQAKYLNLEADSF